MQDTAAPTPHVRKSFEYSTNAKTRSASMIVRLADRFDARLVVYKDGARVEGNSILGLMTLDLRKGARFDAETMGPDAQCLMDELSSLIDSRFGISDF